MTNFSTNSFVSGLMLGVLITGAWFFASDSSSLTSEPVLKGAAGAALREQSGAISVADQSAGDVVTVESVTVPPPGVWIAVRDVSASGDLGNVLGAARVGSPRTNLSIPLLRPTEVGRSYAVQLYRDDGGNAFDPAVNSVYVDFDTGTRVVAYFKTTD